MGVTAITSVAQFREIIHSGRPIVIDFWAPWCGPCRTISPIFERMSERPLGVGFYKVDVDEQTDIAQEVGIKAMPTFTLFKDGEKVNELVGANPAALTQLLQQGQGLC